MTIDGLMIHHVRIIERAELKPSSTANLIVGPNAAGKTSLLEAIDTLSRGRSFRTHHFDRLVAEGEAQFTISAILRSAHEPATHVGLQKSRTATRIRINDRRGVSIADLASLLPVQILHPESHQLIQGGAALRRSYLDWGTFHVEPRFLVVWQRYHRTLRQRNAALRSAMPADVVRAWNVELAESARLMDGYRRDYARVLAPVLDKYLQELLGERNFGSEYQRGWAEDIELDALLDRETAGDQQRGYTKSGPHRADLDLRLHGRPVSGIVSRGQQKMLVAALKLAQTGLFNQQNKQSCVFLLDDLPAELERRNRERVMRALLELDVQVFMTAICAEHIDAPAWPNLKMFHVERGHIHEMI